ncbi:MAG TPA: c-type cytochrome, partial [Burkholderiales bacterium]
MILLLGLGAAGTVWAQSSVDKAQSRPFDNAQGRPDGEQVFKQNCVSCHNGAPESRAPALDALKARTPQAVIESLMTGAMRAQGSRLGGPERRA